MPRLIASALLVALLATACDKTFDNITVYREEATATTLQYRSEVALRKKRIDAALSRNASLDRTAPGFDDIEKLLRDAQQRRVELAGLVERGPAGKSALEQQADDDVKAERRDELVATLENTRHRLDEGLALIDDDMTAVEGWIGAYDAAHPQTK